jgi:hypothetical protein
MMNSCKPTVDSENQEAQTNFTHMNFLPEM